MDEETAALPHAFERLGAWLADWAKTGRLVLLLDFDGTLAPIVEKPEAAEMLPEARRALERLVKRPGVDAAVVSGRGMADARGRARLQELAYAGNHGMEIEGPGLRRIHEEAEAARPALERVRDAVSARVEPIGGALVEDKRLTLSVHYRLVERARVEEVRRAVHDAASSEPGLRVTEGKEVLEVRPHVDWHKGRAVEFLLEQFRPPPGVPVLYLGDDTTDEDAFLALRERAAAEGVIVADPPPRETAARCYVRDPGEVAALLRSLADGAPQGS